MVSVPGIRLHEKLESTDLAGRAVAYTHTNRSRFVAELADFVRFPSVSAQSNHADDVEQCAASEGPRLDTEW